MPTICQSVFSTFGAAFLHLPEDNRFPILIISQGETFITVNVIFAFDAVKDALLLADNAVEMI